MTSRKAGRRVLSPLRLIRIQPLGSKGVLSSSSFWKGYGLSYLVQARCLRSVLCGHHGFLVAPIAHYTWDIVCTFTTGYYIRGIPSCNDRMLPNTSEVSQMVFTML